MKVVTSTPESDANLAARFTCEAEPSSTYCLGARVG